VQRSGVSKIAILAGLASLVGALSYAYVEFEHEAVVARSERQSIALTRAIADSLATDLQSFVQSFKAASPAAIRRAPETEALRERLRSIVTGKSILKIKVYSIDGVTVFSSEPSQIGGTSSSGVDIAAVVSQKGHFSKLEHRSKFVGFDSVLLDCYVVSSYVPVSIGETVVAVLEIYSDVTAVATAVEQRHSLVAIAATAVVGVAGLWLFLPRPSRRAAASNLA